MGEAAATIAVTLTWIDWAIVLFYLSAMIAVGFFFRKKQRTFEDYFLASKGLTLPLLIGTLVSTFYGLDTLFGTSEIGFFEGVTGFFAYALPYTGLYLLMAFLAPRFRELEGNTFIDLIGGRYGKFAQAISACSSFFYSINTMEMMGIGFIFTLLFKVPFSLGVLIAAVIVVAYTYTGGLWAVAVTDMVQFTIMALSLGLALIFCWNDLGGYSGVYEGLTAYLGDDPWYYFSPSGGYLTGGVIAAYALTSLAVLCEPAFMQRIYASRSPREARRALLISTPIWTAYEFACCMLGLAAVAAVGLGVIGEPHANQALLALAAHYLPPGLIGLFLAGVLAAAMSTADSYFLVSSGNLVYDLYRPLFRPEIPPDKLMIYTKRAVLISAAVSVALSFYFERIMGVWVFQASILINTVLIPLYTAVFFKKLPQNKLGGSLAAATGFFGTIFYYLLITTAGFFSEEWGTMILRINLCGHTVELWQEYGIFLIPPFVLLAFLIGMLCGKNSGPEEAL
ncbi:MAG: sodium:solute symporter family protein [Firmicutes bacterium]|jgi:SSS family solute:Na+ symporter|nr:sodium:solute symporter family protein [Bacillota bacterium]